MDGKRKIKNKHTEKDGYREKDEEREKDEKRGREGEGGKDSHIESKREKRVREREVCVHVQLALCGRCGRAIGDG